MRRILLGSALLLLTLACTAKDGSGEATPTPGPQPSPQRTETALPREPPSGAPLYIALGDSLSEGVGASNPLATAFVPLVQLGFGPDFGLLNLGHSGDTSRDLIDHGHLDEAIRQIEDRNQDQDPNNDVKLITLEIGGNDLLDLFDSLVLSGTCPGLKASLQKPECINPLVAALEGFQPKLETILDRLRGADSEVPIAVLTLYDPFSGSLPTLSELAVLALEGLPDTPVPEGLNDGIRREVQERGLILVDLYPLFEGKGKELIALDLIHPNDAGYRVMADAVLAALKAVHQ